MNRSGRPSAWSAARLMPLLVVAGCSAPVVLPEPDSSASGTRPGSPTDPAAAPPATARPAPKPAPKPAARPVTPPAASASRPGRYYMDDGPEDNPPLNLELTADARPRPEPLHPRANRPYVVFGRSYVPKTQLVEYRERGVASWYGRKFHGNKTSTGEVYDMYAMSAAHPTLPVPSYARVTNLRNGRSVVVRVNDRGPFLHRRAIDLSYTAAYKLGYAHLGSTEVEVELIRVDGVAALPMQASVKADVADRAEAAGPNDAAQVATLVPTETGAQADAGAPADSVPMRLTFETFVGAEPGAARSPPAALAGKSAGVPAGAPAAAQSGAPAGAGTVYLQLGAFSSRENAEVARARFARELDWLQAPVAVLAQGSSFKVQAGPWPRREDAGVVAERIAREMDFRPMPVVR